MVESKQRWMMCVDDDDDDVYTWLNWSVCYLEIYFVFNDDEKFEHIK